MIPAPVRSGLAALPDDYFYTANVGLVTNQTGIDTDFRPTTDVVAAMGGRIVALFGPEHGYYGVAAEGAGVATEQADIPVYSLYRPGDPNPYGPPPGSLAGLDALIFDIQDVGLRYYTYLSTLGILLETADRNLVIFVVDRPNPLGDVVEGPILDPAFASFVGRYPVPVRHGLTIGEMARFINDYLPFRTQAHLLVLPMTGWQRTMAWEETGLPWVAPSPNLPTLTAVRLYGGTCLGEGTNLSVGRGTSQPFELIGAPYITDPARLAAALNALARPGLHFRATFFKPAAALYAGNICGGVQLHLTDPRTAPPEIVRSGLLLVATIAHMYPDAFAWRTDHFDRLTGSDVPRRTITDGGDLRALFDSWAADETAWAERRASSLLYT